MTPATHLCGRRSFVEKHPLIHWRSASCRKQQERKIQVRIALLKTDESTPFSSLPRARAIGLFKSLFFHRKARFLKILSKFFVRLIYKKTNTLWNLSPIGSATPYFICVAKIGVFATASRCWKILDWHKGTHQNYLQRSRRHVNLTQKVLTAFKSLSSKLKPRIILAWCHFSRVYRFIRACFFIITISTVVSACGPTNQTERAHFIDPPQLQQTLATSGLKINYEEASWPKEEWWHNYKNVELNRLITKALQDNQNLKKAGETLQAADASVRVAGAKLLPSLQSDYWARQSRNPIRGVVASYNPLQGGLEKTAFFLTPFVMTWELDFWGKNRAALEAAIGVATAQTAEFEQTRLLLTTGVTRAYVRGYAYSKQLEITTELVSLRKELLTLAETRFETGLDTADGIQMARSDYESSIRREATVRAALTIQQDALARMIGEGPDATRGIFTNQKNLVLSIPKIPKHLPIELLAHRPDLAAALSRAEAAAERIHLAKTLFLPSMDLSVASGIEASVTTSSMSLLSSRLFTPGASGFSVVPGFHLPIFQAGRLTGTLEIQRAEYDQAVNSYNETLLQSAQQVADSLANIKRATTEFEAQNHLVQAANNQLQLAQTRLQDGLKDRREILMEQIDLLESKFIQKTLDGDRMVASVDLYQALGGGYSAGPNPLKPRPSPESDPLTPVVNKIQSITGG